MLLDPIRERLDEEVAALTPRTTQPMMVAKSTIAATLNPTLIPIMFTSPPTIEGKNRWHVTKFYC